MTHSTKTAIMAIALVTSTTAFAATPDRSGQEVVEQVCAACHATGKDGAPKVGDMTAWLQRAAKGLAEMNTNAIRGYRGMPAHGGSGGVSDVEISRAIFYMMSGRESNVAKPFSSPVSRSGKEIVAAKCIECHGTGAHGAPKIGVMADWTPRLKTGIDAMVANAIRGHNQSMPARGGMPNLSDAEIKLASEYMLSKQGK
jgi:cytochrome c5